MTGTADTEAVEFKKIYNLDVVVIPTNRKIQRKDEVDVIYLTATEKYKAIAEEIAAAQQKGQPVLVGTVSVEKSELLSNLLKKKNIAHSILNAKNHAGEAGVIENSGKLSHVTIATNMAGRGTDIKLGEGVKEVGGLYVIGTERHESRRIDNQLRGRSGRQGDPGRSKFFLSLEDDLMRIFASDRVSSFMGRIGMEEGEAIVSPMISRTIEKAQKRVEEQNFSSRKHVLEYDDVMSQQRQVVYQKRRLSLLGEFKIDFLEETIEDILIKIANKYSPAALNAEKWNLVSLKEEVDKQFQYSVNLSKIDPNETSIEAICEVLKEQLIQSYEHKVENIPPELRVKLESYVYLQIIDQAWKEHLLAMDSLKDSVSLRGYAQRDPLQEYKKEAFNLFSMMMERVDSDVCFALLHMPKPEAFAGNSAEGDQEKGADAMEASSFFSSQSGLKSQSHDRSEEKLIYHGSRASKPHTAANDSKESNAPQPIRRSVEKVGRNSPVLADLERNLKNVMDLFLLEAEMR